MIAVLDSCVTLSLGDAHQEQEIHQAQNKNRARGQGDKHELGLPRPLGF